MIEVKESIKLTVHNCIISMGGQLICHLNNSLQADDTFKFNRKDKERYIMSVCFLFGGVIPNINQEIDDALESSNALQYTLQNYDNFLAKGKGTFFPSLKFKFSDSNNFPEENTEIAKWFAYNFKKNDKNNPVTICVETGMEAFYLFVEGEKTVKQESPVLGASIFKKGDVVIEGLQKLIDDKNIQLKY